MSTSISTKVRLFLEENGAHNGLSKGPKEHARKPQSTKSKEKNKQFSTQVMSKNPGKQGLSVANSISHIWCMLGSMQVGEYRGVLLQEIHPKGK